MKLVIFLLALLFLNFSSTRKEETRVLICRPAGRCFRSSEFEKCYPIVSH
jgi:hypothetical protein